MRVCIAGLYPKRARATPLILQCVWFSLHVRCGAFGAGQLMPSTPGPLFRPQARCLRGALCAGHEREQEYVRLPRSRAESTHNPRG